MVKSLDGEIKNFRQEFNYPIENRTQSLTSEITNSETDHVDSDSSFDENDANLNKSSNLTNEAYISSNSSSGSGTSNTYGTDCCDNKVSYLLLDASSVLYGARKVDTLIPRNPSKFFFFCWI